MDNKALKMKNSKDMANFKDKVVQMVSISNWEAKIILIIILNNKILTEK
jgi:hypothetical protein